MALHGTGTPGDIGRRLAQSGSALSHTGDTNETTLATVTIPAGAMGANGQVAIETLWSVPNNANNKTVKVKFGATTAQVVTLTTVQSAQYHVRVANRTTGTQVMGNTGTSGYGSINGAVVTASIDTTAAVDVTFLCTCANAADTITLESYQVLLYPS